ncbi:Zinc finger FYVE domain-containing protein 26 [Geranomyces variabilis]|nr:Zinc finger FYVE domain-containing protein 26 [Geranomyces variabilis]
MLSDKQQLSDPAGAIADGPTAASAEVASAAVLSAPLSSSPPQAYDTLYASLSSRRDTAKRSRINISNPVPQHDILYEKNRSKRNSVRPKLHSVGLRSSIEAAAATAAAAADGPKARPLSASFYASTRRRPPSLFEALPEKSADDGAPVSAAQPPPVISEVPASQEPRPRDLSRPSQRPKSATQLSLSGAAPAYRPSLAPPPSSHSHASQTASFASRFGSIGVVSRNPPARKLQKPRTRPSLASLLDTNGALSAQSSLASSPPTPPPPTPPVLRRPHEATASFENMHSLAELEFFFLGLPLVNRTREFLRADDVFKVVVGEADEQDDAEGGMVKQTLLPRKLFLCDDVLIYGTAPESGSAQARRAAYAKQTVLQLASLECFPVDSTTLPVVDLETPSHALRVAFATHAARDDWTRAVRTAARARRAALARAKGQRRSSTSSVSRPASLTEWGFMKLWQGVELATSGKRGTVVPRNNNNNNNHAGSFGSVSSMDSLSKGWIPDEEAVVCMICRTTKFSVLTRKHHCRKCGRVICWKCSKMEAAIRVCTDCHDDVIDPIP